MLNIASYQDNLQSLLCCDSLHENKEEAPEVHTYKKQQLNKIKVLLVEDEPINQFVNTKLLESKGFFVDVAPTGQAALDLYNKNDYAVILMDMGLPDLPGTDVTRKIRELEQINGKHIPIIALTSNGLSAKSACLAAGMDDFSLKPFEIETLSQLIKTWMEKLK